MPADPKVDAGVCAWIVADGQLLMLHRNNTLPGYHDGQDTWSVPGGWIEHKETYTQAVERETLEEVGLVVRSQGVIGATCEPADNGSFTAVTLFVQCELMEGIPVNNEPDKVDIVCWVNLEDVPALPLFHPITSFLDEPLTKLLASLDMEL